MQLETSRFGPLTIDVNGILLFPEGLVGFEDRRHWVLLEDESEPIGWLQNLADGDLAVPVVTPQHVVPGYQLRFHRRELTSMPWSPADQALVLVVVSRHAGQLTANLKAPVLVNLDRGLGRQVLTCDAQPLRFEISGPLSQLRKAA